MDDSPQTPAGDGRQFRDLLALCIERVGEDGFAAAEPILKEYPQHAEALRKRLGTLHRVGLLTEPEKDDDPIPERLGEFRIVRRLGSGGMGVVYLAVQESLGREVALKLVRPEQLFFPGARERFRREVEAVARLNDPGIVPIYTVGEEAGIPFFAMEYVVGATLADVIRDFHGRRVPALKGRDLASAIASHAGGALAEPLPELFAGTWAQTAARIVMRMAQAVEHAHGRGVLHRDLKPSNAIVTPSGRVLLLDFGLASAEGTTRLTRSGSQQGTLQYMSPEQVRGEVVGARSDVYSLGATLFELLALHAPYDDDNSERLRKAILDGNLPRLAAGNAPVPSDLDTIVRHACDRDAARRYPTAAALSDDLLRFLEHRPIAARPAAPWLHVGRWAQRRPALVTIVALSLAIGLVTPFLLMDRLRLRSSAQQNLQEALLAIEHLSAQASSPAMAATPGLDSLRIQQLDAAVHMLQRLRGENDGSPAVRHALGRGLLKVAELRRMLGQLAESDRSLAGADAELRRLAQEFPGERIYQADLAWLEMCAGENAKHRGDLTAASARWAKSIEMLTTKDTGRGADPAAPPHEQRMLARCLGNLGTAHLLLGRLDDAERLLLEARALDERLGAENPADRLDQASTRANLAWVLMRRGSLREALAQYEALRDLHKELVAGAPKDPERRRELARMHNAIATAHSRLEEHAPAQAAQEEALKILDAVVAEFPDRPLYRQERDLSEQQAASFADARSDLAAAEDLMRKAVRHHEELIAARPDRPESRAELASMLDGLARLLGKGEHEEECGPLLERAVALLRALVAEHPADAYYQASLASVSTTLGLHHLTSGAPKVAAGILREATAHFDKALAAGSLEAKEPAKLPNTLLALAHACAASDDPDGAFAALSRRQDLVPEKRPVLEALGHRLGLARDERFVALLAKAPE